MRGAYARSSRHAGRAAMDVMVLRDEQHLADGEIVWSWRRDAGVKLAGDDLAGDGGKKARSPGRARISRNPSRREGWVFSAAPVVPAPCVLVARGPWASAGARSSLRPLLFRGCSHFQNSDAIRAARTRGCGRAASDKPRAVTDSPTSWRHEGDQPARAARSTRSISAPTHDADCALEYQ